jgi:SH3-like domain-containing protein
LELGIFHLRSWIFFAHSGKFHATEARRNSSFDKKTRWPGQAGKMVKSNKRLFIAGLAALILAALPMSVVATPSAKGANDNRERGVVTNLPIPRFVSMKAKDGNARRGPGLTYRIDWVFQHTNTPLLVTAEYGHWRRVQDKDGQGGWMHYALLSGVRTVIVTVPNMALRIKPNVAAATGAYAEEGAIANLNECSLDWCFISADGASGWALKTDLWGVWADEIRD